MLDKTSLAEARAKDANRMILAFCVAVSLLLLLLGYVIISYTRKANRYSEALKKAKLQAETLAKMKESFMSTMSHEIRTPMNAIYGFSEQLLSSPLNSEQKAQTEIIKKSADHLIHIVNDVLDFSKLGVGKLELTNVGFRVKEIVEDVVSMMKPQAETKKILFHYFIDKSLPEVLIGDSFRLKQVLINIISNAIKFTDEGEVDLFCAPILENTKTVRLQIIVKDTGIGIRESQIKNIFNEFEQAESTIAKKNGGTGLGLTITKKLISLQGGSIEVNSTEGRGTIVTFSVPYRIGTTEELEVPEPLKVNELT